MIRRTVFVLLTTMPVFLMTEAAGAQAQSLRIVLKPEAVVAGAYVLVADLASEIDAGEPLKGEVASLQTARRPRTGNVERIAQVELDAFIRTHVAERDLSIEWQGAKAVQIRAATQTLEGKKISEEAARYLAQQLSGRFAQIAIEPASEIADLSLPLGQIGIKVRDADLRRPYGRVPLWVDVSIDGEVCRSVIVPMQVKIVRKAWIARRDLPAGTQVTERDFGIEEITAARSDGDVLDAFSGQMIVRKKIAMGQMLTRSDVADASSVLRGDKVRLVSGNGALSVETFAVAQNDGDAGAVVTVKPLQGTGVVEARVIASGVVRLEER